MLDLEDPLEPQTWQVGPTAVTAQFLGRALRFSGELPRGADIVSFRFDPAFVCRGEGDKLRRLILGYREHPGPPGPSSLFAKDATPAEVAFYRVVAPLARGTGLRLPKALHLSDRLILLEDVPGTHWGGELNALPRLVAAYAQLHAATWGGAALEPLQVPRPGPGACFMRDIVSLQEWRRLAGQSWIGTAIEDAKQFGALGPRCAAFCRAVLADWAACEAALQPHRCVVHGDPHSGNAVDAVGGGAPCLLDFEFAAVGHPVWDLAVLMLRLWAPHWAAAPAALCSMVAEAYTAGLDAVTAKGYSAAACAQDLQLSVALAAAGFCAELAGARFQEWWREIGPHGGPPDQGVPAAVAQWLEDSLQGPSERSLLAALPRGTNARYRDGLRGDGAAERSSAGAADGWDVEF